MNRREFISQLIAELTHFILDSEPLRMVVSLHQEEDGLHLAVLDTIQRTEEELAAIRSSLNDNERPELAGYYGSMAGYDTLGSARLSLVGWQVKGADVSSSSSGTKIDLWLGGERFDPGSFSLPGDGDGARPGPAR